MTATDIEIVVAVVVICIVGLAIAVNWRAVRENQDHEEKSKRGDQ